MRKVKCHVTGEIGDSDHFVKIGKYYYKNQYVYEEDKRLKEARSKLIDYICTTFLHYREGQPFPTSLPKKLAELDYYDDTVILETFHTYESDILYWMEHKQFSSDFNRIAYMIAIVKEHIAEVNRQYIRQGKIRKEQEREQKTFTDPAFSTGSQKAGKDLTAFLGGDEL